MEIDVRIRGGRVHSAHGAQKVDILISGERIVGVVDPGLQVEAAQTIDADGLDVLPGLVDLHAHARTPGLEHKEDFRTLSSAAAVGGITTYVDMPNVEPPTTNAQLLREKREIASRDSIVDWGHFASGSQPDRIQELAEAGATGFKIFMVSGAYPHDERIAVSANDALYAALEAIAATGLPCLVHPFDQALFNLFIRRAWAAGQPDDHRTRVAVYTGIDLVWRSAIATLIEFQKDTGVRLHVLHTHATGSLELIQNAKRAGHRITAALDPKYFHLTRADMERLGPRAYSGAVVTEDPARLALIWQSLRDGTIDTIDSDHGPHTLEEVDIARTDASKAQLGSPQYDDMLAILLNDVNQGKLTIEDIVRLLAVNPARLIGRYPQKGAIQAGADADLVLVDLHKEVELRDENVKTKVGWTPYHGWRVKGVPVLTLLRGRIVARDGEVTGDFGYGRYLEGRPLEFAEPGPGVSPGLALRPRRGTPESGSGQATAGTETATGSDALDTQPVTV